jgi:hypothetical protein
MKDLLKNILAVCLFVMIASPAWPQEMQESDALISKMTAQLDLQPDQVAGITPIIQRYVVLFANLQKSIRDGTINASSVDSQRQQLEDAETQDLSQYLKPYQLSEWRNMQAQMDQQGQGNGEDNGSDEYSNYPQNPSSP